MPRLIEFQHVKDCSGLLLIRLGDVVQVPASGGGIQSGTSIELGGPYLPATAIVTGEILTPMGFPSVLLIWARKSGPSIIEIITGDPWRETQRTILHIMVEE